MTTCDGSPPETQEQKATQESNGTTETLPVDPWWTWSRTDTETREQQRGRSCVFCLAPAPSVHLWPTDHAEDCPRREGVSP